MESLERKIVILGPQFDWSEDPFDFYRNARSISNYLITGNFLFQGTPSDMQCFVQGSIITVCNIYIFIDQEPLHEIQNMFSAPECDMYTSCISHILSYLNYQRSPLPALVFLKHLVSQVVFKYYIFKIHRSHIEQSIT